MICCGIFGGFLFICICIIVIFIIKLLNICRKRNEIKKGGKFYIDSNNIYDIVKESDFFLMILILKVIEKNLL